MQYEVTYNCGHKGTVSLGGKLSEREREIYRYEHYCLCPECQAKKREEENKKNAEKAQAMNLPELTGSEKQIAWAETIRMQCLTKNESIAKQMQDFIVNKNEDFYAQMKLAEEKGYENLSSFDKTVHNVWYCFTKTEAKWFIENRFNLK